MSGPLRIIEKEYRGMGEVGKRAVKVIAKLTSELLERHDVIKIMHVCGTHEDTVTRFGLRNLMPKGLQLVAGPGCPVCVTPASVIDSAIELAKEGVRIFTYGDLYRVPGNKESLSSAKSSYGCDVKIVYGFKDAVNSFDGKESVFLGVGFETTAPTTATMMARGKVPKAMSLLSAYRLTAPGLDHAMLLHKERGIPLRGVIAPGHVSSIIGAKAWSYLADHYGLPVVVAGFEPLDYVLAVLEILRQIKEGEARLVNEYRRVVTWDGNVKAWNYVMKAFSVVDAYWRGIGVLKNSGLNLKGEFSPLDAVRKYSLSLRDEQNDLPTGCRCAEITLGLAVPTDCPHFNKSCTTSHPLGPCMVSREGTCNVWARHGGYGLIDELLGEMNIEKDRDNR